ncbi:uncharacterized protein LOC110693687 isoform X2 [Chenopodium quinoa]|uniref:uncharacterized protein LOC110693687 isoform X2 n=1 Tax=Chenopodium quinoa TaxID=63459 RepID=UPI000B7929C4|nr:uncharacterized protein LOC110693687 isoform X2 [Chenopodium quinoa]
MGFQKEYLDLVLVPFGITFMFVYHIALLYRYLNHPETTVVGLENHNKRAWVERVMELDDLSSMELPLSALSSNTSAATYLASISLGLSSLIGAWIASNNKVFESEIIYGDRTPTTMMLKYISLLICFFLAFFCFVQATRYFINATYLISMPNSNTPIYYVEVAIIRGGEFWQLGLRALYFALNLLLWFFGPIPMFVSSVFMVVLLHYLDLNSIPLHQFQASEKQRGSQWSPTGPYFKLEREV